MYFCVAGNSVAVFVSERSKIGLKVDTPFKCLTCGKMYSRKGPLSRHMKYECGKEPQFCCPYCPYRSKQKSVLKTHMLRKHFPM